VINVIDAPHDEVEKNKMNLTPQQRALLESVSIPDVALGGLPQIRLLQSNSPQLLDTPETSGNLYLKGAMAGGFDVPGPEGRLFIPGSPGFHYGIFGFDHVFVEYETQADGSLQRVGEPYAEKPKDAQWLEDASGRRVCQRDNGNPVQEHIGCLMKIEPTNQVGIYVFSKTALRIGRELANAAQRLRVDGLDGVKGAVLGRFRMSSRLEKKGDRRWFLPVWTLVGKLGQPGGPSLETVLELAEMRKAFKAGMPPALEIEPPAPPAPSSIDEAPPLDEPLDGPPPPEGYDSPDNPDNDPGNFDFGP
jgi:hypothetical protein